VTESGVISYPLLGSMRVGGLTVTQAEAAIADGLRKGNFVKQPQVSIAILQVRGNQANVLGQVNRPGRYPIEVADMRVTDMLALASGGGLTQRGTERGIRVHRRSSDKVQVIQPAMDDRLQDGDVVYVRESLF